MISEILNAENLVKQILAECPETRSNDKELIIKVWEAQGLYLSDEQLEIFKKCFSTETIRRTRQKLQEEGLYPATENIQNKRRKLEQQTRDFFVSNKSTRKIIDYDYTSKPGFALPIQEGFGI